MSFINEASKTSFSTVLSLGFLWASALGSLVYGLEKKTSSTFCDPNQEEVEGTTPDGKGHWCESDGKKNGKYEVFYTENKKKIETSFKNGHEHGSYVLFSESGEKLKEGSFKNGKLDGYWKRWYSNGKLKDEGEWDSDRPIGTWIFYHDTGALKESGDYQCGEKSGVWKTGNPDGSPSNNHGYLGLKTCSFLGKVFQIRAGEWIALQGSQLAYSPYFALLPKIYTVGTFEFKALLGVATFNDLNTSRFTPVVEGLAEIGMRPFQDGMNFEVGAGVQYWMGKGASPEFLVGVSSPAFGKSWMPFRSWAEIYLNYVMTLLPFGMTHGVRVGVSLYFP